MAPAGGDVFWSSLPKTERETAGTAVEGSRAYRRGTAEQAEAIAGCAGDPLPRFAGTPPSQAMGEI